MLNDKSQKIYVNFLSSSGIEAQRVKVQLSTKTDNLNLRKNVATGRVDSEISKP